MRRERDGDRRAWGWVEHLRAGGTTTWRDWRVEGEPRSRLIPGAQHLEVVRRLNLIEPVPQQLADVVLHTSGPGRGQQDLDLEGVGASNGFGPLPIDPAEIPTDELLRVATGALADLAPMVPLSDPTPRSATAAIRRRLLRRPLLLRTSVRVTGDPLLAIAFRRQLRREGWPPGGHNPQVLVMLSDYGTYLADCWAVQARRGNAASWHQWLRRFVGEEGLPDRIDILSQAELWAGLVGRDQVHPVFDPAAVSRITGVTSLRAPRRFSHAALEVVRQTSTALRIVVDDERRQRLVTHSLLPWLRDADDGRLPGPGVPRVHLGWLAQEAARIRDRLAAAGYPVPVETLDRLLPIEPARATSPDDLELLGVTLKALHRGARELAPKGDAS